VFQHAVDVVPNNYFAENHLGLAYWKKGEKEEAGKHYAKAVHIAPDYDSSNTNFGCYLADKGKLEEAAACFQQAIHTNPYQSGPYANMAMVRINQRKFDEAIPYLEKADELQPGIPIVQWNLGVALIQAGRIPEGLLSIRRLQESAGGVPWQQLIEMFWKDPKNVILLNDIAWFLATDDDSRRNGKEAVRFAMQAVELSEGKMPGVLDTLAAAYAETRQFNAARQTADRAIKLALQQNKPELAKKIQT